MFTGGGGLSSGFRGLEPTVLGEVRLLEEIASLKEQLGSANAQLELARSGDTENGSKKRHRQDSGKSPGSSSPFNSDSAVDISLHPLSLKVDLLQSQLEEERVARQLEAQRHKIAMGEAERTKGKLQRQVKFLAEEEEEARKELERKQEMFLAEQSRLEESLKEEKLATAQAGEEAKQHGQRDCDKLERCSIIALWVGKEKVFF
ncbi:unnamed protein product [Choristocarpus tenellus]